MSGIGKQLRQENVADIDLVDMAATPLQESLVGEARQRLLAMMAAVAFLLLVACANVANLVLAQVTARQREFTVRVPLTFYPSPIDILPEPPDTPVENLPEALCLKKTKLENKPVSISSRARSTC